MLDKKKNNARPGSDTWLGRPSQATLANVRIVGTVLVKEESDQQWEGTWQEWLLRNSRLGGDTSPRGSSQTALASACIVEIVLVR